MSEDKLLSALARRAREQRDEKIDAEPLDKAADERIAKAILATSKPKLTAIEGGRRKNVVVPFAFAAAAAVALFFLWPRDRGELPLYAFELSGNVAEVRADGPKVVEQRATLHRDATLQIVLRPSSPVKQKINASAVLVRDGKARPWSPPIEISSDGAVRIVGPVKTLLPDTDGPWDIVVAIGETLPSDIVSAAANPPPGVRVVRARIDFTP